MRARFTASTSLSHPRFKGAWITLLAGSFAGLAILGACSDGTVTSKVAGPNIPAPRFAPGEEGEFHHRVVVCVDPLSSPGSYSFSSVFFPDSSGFFDKEDNSIDPDLSGFGITQNKLGPYVPGDIITTPVNMTPGQCTDVFVRMTSFQDSANRLWTGAFGLVNPSAALTITAAIPAGYTYSVKCVNDDIFLPQTDGCAPGPIVANPIVSSANVFHGSSVTYTIKAPNTPTPLFVIGDVEPHAVTDNVYFWGAQWWKNNVMSGPVDPGAVGGSFKGYASESDNFCGGVWATRPGNSPPPPAEIGQPVAIIVTSTVLKNGPVISGNIVQILLVHHDGNYDNNPGHPGRGPVVEILCTVP